MRPIVLLPLLAAIAVSGCDRTADPLELSEEETQTVPDFGTTNRLLGRADGAVCADRAVADEIESLAVGESNLHFSNWSGDDEEVLRASYRSALSNIVFDDFNKQTKLTKCSANFRASAGGDSWSERIEYTVQPALDGPQPIITIQNVGPIRTVNYHIWMAYHRDVVEPRLIARSAARQAEAVGHQSVAASLPPPGILVDIRGLRADLREVHERNSTQAYAVARVGEANISQACVSAPDRSMCRGQWASRLGEQAVISANCETGELLSSWGEPYKVKRSPNDGQMGFASSEGRMVSSIAYVAVADQYGALCPAMMSGGQ